jgi:hypothetical protein
MANFCRIFLLGLLAACAAQHAARINCDGKLRPINAPVPPVAAPLASAVYGKTLNGAP